MSNKTILSQRLNEQLNDFRKAMDEFAESFTKIFEKYGLSSDETECEQPDTDTISRQDAIAALKKACNGCSDDNYGVILCNAAIKVIKALPSSPSRPPWIPVTERLPKKHGESYIVTISDGAVYSAALQWDANCKRWYLSFLKDGNILVDFIEDVIAWMPLPEPYRP